MFAQLLFNEEVTLLRYEFLPDKPSTRELLRVENKFLHSLRPGDRRRFRQYCTSYSAGHDLTFELFSFPAFLSYRHAFCEHSYTDHLLYTAVFLAKEASDFHALISPASLTYAPTNERILRELFLLSGTSEENTAELPPEMLPLIARLPNVTRVLRSADHECGYCDIRKLTKKTLENLQKTPDFMHTELYCTPFSGTSPLWNLEFSSNLYVLILSSVLTALVTVSADHRIELNFVPAPSWSEPAVPGVDVRISTAIPDDPPALRRMNDSGTLRVIATPGTVTELHLGTASVLASIAGVETSVMTVLSTGRLEICLSVLSRTKHPVPEFHYRDPYAAVDTLVQEFMDFANYLSSLLSSDD